MDDDVIIEAEHISKKYCKSLGRSMWYGIKDIVRNTMGLSSHSYKLRKNEFWAVDDISFRLKRGEVLGIIGPNGSGKTTLLKMINGIFWPDKGKISVRGRVGALIEVGAGFHPSLTGKENVYVNGAILGMSKEEIDEKYDNIIKFADIGDFINTPVKYYSSGMFVRLGFAVAIHCDVDLLLVDEVLAVGDSAFRIKCMQKMNALKRRDDLAIVIVSHHLYTIEKFCDKGLFLYEGKIKREGDIIDVIRRYQAFTTELLQVQGNLADAFPDMPHCTKEIEILNVTCVDENGKEKKEFAPGEKLGIRVEYRAKNKYHLPVFFIIIYNQEGIRVCTFGNILDDIKIESVEGRGVFEVWIDKNPFLLNRYFVYVSIQNESMTAALDYWNGSLRNFYFNVLPDITSQISGGITVPIFRISHKWKINGEEFNLEE